MITTCQTFLFLLCAGAVQATPIAVKHVEGTEHAFLCIRDLQGKRLASGELVQVGHGEELASNLIFHFVDGSVFQQSTIYSQHGAFRLVSDHQIQKGKSFPTPVDILVEASGQITTRVIGGDGKETIRHEHMDLPPDTANGLLMQVMLNLQPSSAVTELPMVAPTEKPRMVKLEIQAQGEKSFSVGGGSRKATDFVIKTKIGGLAGMIAPLIGKQPADVHVWILEGQAPAFIKEEGPLYIGGPTWRIEQESPVIKEGSGT